MNKFIIVFLGLIISFSLFSINCFAAEDRVEQGAAPDNSGVVELPNPLGNIETMPQLANQVIRGGLGIVGSLTLLMFIYGGWLWLMSAGDSKKIDQGKNIIIWSTVGLAIIFSSYALVKFVITSIGG